MKKLIQIGAGNIGRACIGRLFHEACYKIYFSDVMEHLLEAINEKKEYKVRLVGKDVDNTVIINNVDRIPKSEEELVQLFDEVSIVTTAVGVNILPKIATFIADIIKRRYETNNTAPLNVMACENTTGASSKLKENVHEKLPKEIIQWLDGKVAFANVAIDCIVPNVINEDPLTVTCENFAELIIDKTIFIGDLPKVDGLFLKDHLEAYIERKLFTLNTGHAITAYLGFKNNKETIYDSISDDSIKEIVLSAMKESGEVLIKRYNFKREEHHKYIEKILSRFFNPYLKDSVLRVGREPIRKLSYNDRLIKPTLGTLEYRFSHENLVKGIAAAFQFYNPDDKESIDLKKMIEKENLKEVIIKITGLNKENEKDLCEEIYKLLYSQIHQ